ncbi:MAG TPA: hypothetical protein DCE56_44125 [Cyanobacteria bacterium UBA8553]|nr:hypothetical protein [Cyanobacteria bacterium UBA8553]
MVSYAICRKPRQKNGEAFFALTIFFLDVSSTLGLSGIDARGQEEADLLGSKREVDPPSSHLG